MSNSPIRCLPHYLYRSALMAEFLECTMHHFSLIIALSYIHMFIYDMLHPYILVRPNTPGAYVPCIMVW